MSRQPSPWVGTRGVAELSADRAVKSALTTVGRARYEWLSSKSLYPSWLLRVASSGAERTIGT